MNNNEKKLPRATAELAAEYDRLMEKYEDYDYSLSEDERDDIACSLSDLHANYDWSNYVFTNPETGKKGVMDVTGKTLVPAVYDDFSFIGTYHLGHELPKAALKGDKYGFVAGDGSGEELTGFIYNSLVWDPYTCFFKASWGSDESKFGYVTSRGLVFIVNVLTRSYSPSNDFVLLESNGLFGGLDIRTLNFVLPTYENVDVEPDEYVVFYKNGVAGYVNEQTGAFIPKDEFEDNENAEFYFFNSFP